MKQTGCIIHDAENRNCDSNVIASAVGGCELCFQQIVFRYQGKLLSFISRRVKSQHDAEDILQDTFVQAYKNLKSFDDRWQFSTWIYTIANRLIVSFFRKQKASNISIEDNIPSPGNSQLDSIDANEQTKLFWKKISESLPDNQFAAIWLKYAGEMKVKQIAEVLDKSEANIKIILFRARNTIATLFADQKA